MLSGIQIFFLIFMFIFIGLYFIYFYYFIVKVAGRRRFIRRFHNVISSIVADEEQFSFNIVLDRLNLNYKILCQAYPNIHYARLLDLLETIIYYYDSYPDFLFEVKFFCKKNPEILEFMIIISNYIKKQDPFVSIPRKEANLLRSINEALDNNNVQLGQNAVMQLSQEIDTKEKKIHKMEKENQRANIISIVGLILTIFFGLFSIIPFFST